MKFGLFPTPEDLTDYVQHFWTLEGEAGAPGTYRDLPDGCPEIIFQFEGGLAEFGRYNAKLVAQHKVYRDYKVDQKINLLGVRMFPYAFKVLLNTPANTQTDRVSTVNSVMGDELPLKVSEATTREGQIDAISTFLRKHLTTTGKDNVHDIIRQLFQKNGDLSIHEMRELSGLSQRQFERRFLASAGFTPKFLTRILRFHKVTRLYFSGQFNTLVELAFRCGYYDQSHMVREFREFAGIGPVDYFAQLKSDTPQSKFARAMINVKAKDLIKELQEE